MIFKQLSLVFFLFFFVNTLSAQDEKEKTEQKTLFSTDKHFGFYFYGGSKFTTLGGEPATMPNVKFALSAGRAIAFGVEACGLPPMVQYSLDGTPVRPTGGYTGFFVEPIIGSNHVVHLTAPVLLGGGWFGFIDDWTSQNDFLDKNLRDKSFTGIVEPGLNAEVNVFKFLRLNFGASYRLAYGSNFQIADNSYFTGFNFLWGVKLGRF